MKIIFKLFLSILTKSFILFGQRSNLIKDKILYNKRIEYVTAHFKTLNCTTLNELNDLYYSVISELVVHTIMQIKRDIIKRKQ
jgi:hypothetical protein